MIKYQKTTDEEFNRFIKDYHKNISKIKIDPIIIADRVDYKDEYNNLIGYIDAYNNSRYINKEFLNKM